MIYLWIYLSIGGLLATIDFILGSFSEKLETRIEYRTNHLLTTKRILFSVFLWPLWLLALLVAICLVMLGKWEN